jgi:hypothetical protein
MTTRHEARAAQRTIIAQMDACIYDHGSAKQKLDACVLPGGMACGSSPDVVHVHHTALCTLVTGQRILLQDRRDLLEAGIYDDEARRTDHASHSEHGDGDSLMVDRKRGILRANGATALVFAILLALGIVAFLVNGGIHGSR